MSCTQQLSLITNNVLETIINHSYLLVINKDDNRHVFQYCNGLFKVETFMANTMSTNCLGKNGYNPISNIAVTTFNHSHYH